MQDLLGPIRSCGRNSSPGSAGSGTGTFQAGSVGKKTTDTAPNAIKTELQDNGEAQEACFGIIATKKRFRPAILVSGLMIPSIHSSSRIVSRLHSPLSTQPDVLSTLRCQPVNEEKPLSVHCGLQGLLEDVQRGPAQQ